MMRALALPLVFVGCGGAPPVPAPNLAKATPVVKTTAAKLCRAPFAAELAPITASCQGRAGTMSWDPTPAKDPGSMEPEWRGVLVVEGDVRALYQCSVQWIATYPARGECPADSVTYQGACPMVWRAWSSGEGLLVSWPDRHSTHHIDMDGDGCTDQIHGRSASDSNPMLEERDDNADGHSEVRIERHQLPCGLPDRGQTIAVAGCPVEIRVECDDNSDGVVDRVVSGDDALGECRR